ncbi:hypothetical protein SDC9_74926 [bioreactor metagenome]|uniref:Uncharacterized protein n=1 Tax=bioreactor metagenome TaxID=1076179 RepID=A0A644YQM8_9ZZZZ
MRYARHELAVAGLCRVHGAAQGAHFSCGHASGAAFLLPIGPWVLLEDVLQQGEDALALRDASAAFAQCGLAGDLGALHHVVEQAVEDAGVAAVQVERLVAGAKDAGGAGVGADVASALGLHAREQMLH